MDHPSGSTIPSIFRNASTTRSVQKSARSFDETSPSSPTSSSSGFTGKNNTLCLQFRNEAKKHLYIILKNAKKYILITLFQIYK